MDHIQPTHPRFVRRPLFEFPNHLRPGRFIYDVKPVERQINVGKGSIVGYGVCVAPSEHSFIGPSDAAAAILLPTQREYTRPLAICVL